MGWVGREGKACLQLQRQPRMPCAMAGRTCAASYCSFVCNTVCCFVPRIVAMLHQCHVVSHTQSDTIRPRSSCEIHPKGMSLLEGEGRPSQAMRWMGFVPRRREPCARARIVQRRVRCGRQSPHAVCSEKLCTTPCRVVPCRAICRCRLRLHAGSTPRS